MILNEHFPSLSFFFFFLAFSNFISLCIYSRKSSSSSIYTYVSISSIPPPPVLFFFHPLLFSPISPSSPTVPILKTPQYVHTQLMGNRIEFQTGVPHGIKATEREKCIGSIVYICILGSVYTLLT